MIQHIKVSDFFDQIAEYAIDNPNILDLPLDGLYIYPNGMDKEPVMIKVVAEETANG